MTELDWDDGEPIKETVEFVCRAVTIHYLPQLPDGSLGRSEIGVVETRASGGRTRALKCEEAR